MPTRTSRGTVRIASGLSAGTSVLAHGQAMSIRPPGRERSRERDGAQGRPAKSVIHHDVDGIDAYMATAKTNPNLLPADYADAAPALGPQKWSAADVVAVAGPIGGIFGPGGGTEIANAHLRQ